MKYDFAEDCLKVIPNKFELVVLASRRAYDLYSGSKPTAKHDPKDRNTLIALMEVAANTLDLDAIREKVAKMSNSASDINENLDKDLAKGSVLDFQDEGEKEVVNENLTCDDGADNSSNIPNKGDDESTEEINFDNDV